MIRHYTSRAGDPHRHLHLQINARVCAAGAWRGLHTVGVRDSIEAINGIGHAAVMTDPAVPGGARRARATPSTRRPARSCSWRRYVGAFSARTAQIGRNIDRYEAEWRAEHPGEEPGPRLRRAWDARAWAEARPDKVVPTRRRASWWPLGRRAARPRLPRPAEPAATSRRHRDRGGSTATRAAELVVSRLGARRSAWNAADIRGEVEQLIAADRRGRRRRRSRIELAEDITARAARTCVAAAGPRPTCPSTSGR